MQILSREEMQAADKRMIEEIGVPGIVLMEHAALQLKKHVRGRALILCGKGHNGGDGLALARLLFLEKKDPLVLIMTKSPLTGDALIHQRIAQNLGIKTALIYEDLTPLQEALREVDTVVDCLFGTGLTRVVEDPYCRAIALVNQSGRYILSADLPSGIDANTGEVLGCAIRPHKTISFHAMKKGMMDHPDVEVVDIGIEGFWD